MLSEKVLDTVRESMQNSVENGCEAQQKATSPTELALEILRFVPFDLPDDEEPSLEAVTKAVEAVRREQVVDAIVKTRIDELSSEVLAQLTNRDIGLEIYYMVPIDFGISLYALYAAAERLRPMK